jgi:hypothetical protein
VSKDSNATNPYGAFAALFSPDPIEKDVGDWVWRIEIALNNDADLPVALDAMKEALLSFCNKHPYHTTLKRHRGDPPFELSSGRDDLSWTAKIVPSGGYLWLAEPKSLADKPDIEPRHAVDVDDDGV